MNILVNPVVLQEDRQFKKEPPSPTPNPIDSKVGGVVLEKISQGKGGLLSATSAPQKVLDLLSETKLAKHTARKKRKLKSPKTISSGKMPIGLRAHELEGWLNSLMQFIIHIPGMEEALAFAPRSFSPFQQFIDRYRRDQQEGYSCSSANGSEILQFMNAKIPRGELIDFFSFLLSALKSEWKIHQNLEEALAAAVSSDIFVTQSYLIKQLIREKDRLCYELDAFIELRPDGVNANYIAYVKVGGSWYQCDNDRVTLLRSNYLNIPLTRSVLLHYKKLAF